jgi:HSP20 family protein
MADTSLQPKEQRRAKDGPETTHSVCYTPRVDILENDTELTVYADMAGVRPENVDIRYENGELTLYGCPCARPQSANYLMCEYGVGDFYRSFTVPTVIDADKITAEHKNGVLTLHLPKMEAAKPRRITVQGQ